jgi:transcriptional regulator GlxA family with amidase domain
MTAEDTLSALAARTSRAIITALGGLNPGATTVAAACTGVFTLAESGLLDRRRATTSWWPGAAFRSRYPSVVLDLDSMVVADGGIVTAGAAFAHIDLALALVRRVSPTLAGHVARLLVIDERTAQSAYLVTDHLDHNDPLVLIWCPPSQWHWHGAAPDRFMTHLAISDGLAEGQDGPETKRGEHVTDEEYAAR